MPAAEFGIGLEGTARRLDLDGLTGADIVDEPAGEESVGNLADPDARVGAGRGADRIRAAVFGAVDHPPQCQGLSGGEVEELRVVIRDGEGHGRGVLGEVVDGLDRERVEGRA